MVLEKRDLLNRFGIGLYTMFSCLIMSIVNIPQIHILLFWGLVLWAIIESKFDLFHPYFWFSLFFGLYSSANALLYSTNSSYSYHQLCMPMFAMAIVLCVVGSQKIDNIKFNNFSEKITESALKYAIWILIVITVAFSIVINSRGYYSKVQMRIQGDSMYSLGVHIARFLTFFINLYLASVLAKHKKISWGMLIGGGLASLVFSLVTSERDVLFRFGYTIILLLIAYNIIDRKKLLIVFPTAMVAMTLSVYFKHYFLRGTLNDTFIRGGNIFSQFLSSDFTAAGNNLQYLIDTPGTKGLFGIQMYLTEFFNPILIGYKGTNPDYWFNSVIHHSSFGHAFTLVGTGYIIGGYFGVFLVFLTVAIIIKKFYVKSTVNLYWFTSYIYMSSVVIFSFRQSLRSITGAMAKHVLLAVILCYVISKVRVNNISGNKNAK